MTMTRDIYGDIAERTNGDVYLGVVGPVRTGKSTFIKRFMEELVLPNMDDGYDRTRVRDELPQTAAGRTVMTTQPKFVPNVAADIVIGDSNEVSMRLVDCVGYTVPGAEGFTEDGEARMVTTPWFDHEIPFEEAAEIGTKKVITDHSTIGIVMTTDGSIAGIPRENYVDAEERVIADVAGEGRPFIIILNSVDPDSRETRELAVELQNKYTVAVRALNVMKLTEDGIRDILHDILMEFPISRINVALPGWIGVMELPETLPSAIVEELEASSDGAEKLRDVEDKLIHAFDEDPRFDIELEKMELGSGEAFFRIEAVPELFYEALSERAGIDISGDLQLMDVIGGMARAKAEYDRLEGALDSARKLGYGFVYPDLSEMKLEDPEIVRQGGRFGVSLKASAPALQISRVDIETEISPVMGTESQSRELADYLVREFENDPARMWSTNIFGKPLSELVGEGLNNKISNMPPDVQKKLTETLRRIINDGHGGVICVLL